VRQDSLIIVFFQCYKRGRSNMVPVEVESRTQHK